MSKFMEEFKAFALKGNVLDMAVGVIIGAAFKAIVDSLVADIISPILGCLGGVNFTDMALVLFDGKVSIGWGNFVMAIINFIIMAFVLFNIVRTANKVKAMTEKKEEEPEPEAEPEPTKEEVLLTEIRDALKDLKK